MTSSEGHPGPDATDHDADILARLRARDGQGLSMLLDRHGARTRQVLRRSLGKMIADAEIDEAMQSATFNAWRKVGTFDDKKGTLRAWFFVIAKNACLEILRERRRRRWQVDSDELERMAGPARASSDAESQPASDHCKNPFLAALRECVANLPRVQKAVIQADLRSHDVADAGELAAQLKTTKNSIYVSRNGARRALKLALAKRGFDLGNDKAKDGQSGTPQPGELPPGESSGEQP